MPTSYVVAFAGLVQLLLRVLAHRLQQSVPGSVPGVLRDQQRLVDQQRQLIEHLVSLRVGIGIGGDGVCCVEVEAIGEHGQPPEQHPFPIGQQGVRPIHRSAQRLLAAHCGARTAGQQPERIAQGAQDLVGRQRPNARSGQLDGQRQSVEATADLGDDLRVLRCHAELGLGAARAVTEQFQGVVGERQRGHPPAHLSGHPDRFTTGGEQRQGRAHPQQPGDDVGRGVQQVLAVVEEHQHLAVADEVRDHVHRCLAGLVGQTQRAGDGDGHQIRICDRCEVHVPDAVGVVRCHLGGYPHRQPRLARAARTGEGHQAVVPECLLDRADLRPAADETRQLDWKSLFGRGFRGAQGREVVAQIRVTQLRDAFRPG